jgi:hypothetical protein
MTFSLAYYYIGGDEKCPNLDFFAIISQTLLARITKPFALWSPHVAASYHTKLLSFDATSIKIQISRLFHLGIGLVQNLAVALALARLWVQFILWWQL